MESIELNIFIQKVFDGGAETLRIKADAQTSKQELEKLGFNDWVRVIYIFVKLSKFLSLKKIYISGNFHTFLEIFFFLDNYLISKVILLFTFLDFIKKKIQDRRSKKL